MRRSRVRFLSPAPNTEWPDLIGPSGQITKSICTKGASCLAVSLPLLGGYWLVSIWSMSQTVQLYGCSSLKNLLAKFECTQTIASKSIGLLSVQAGQGTDSSISV